MVVAVTGATGMVGGELSRRLAAQGAHLRLVVRDKGRVHGVPGAEIVECSLTNPVELVEAFVGVDMVFNCAAQVSFRFGDDEKMVSTNTDIASHVVNGCIDAGVGRLVHVSSIAALGAPSCGGCVDESCFPDSINGWNGYSLSKYYSENEVWRGCKAGLKPVIVNPSVILGPGNWKGEGSAALFAVLSSGIPFYTEGSTGFVDVRDVVDAMIDLSLEENAVGKRFILSAANLSFRGFITKAALSTGRKPPYIKVGKKLLRLAVWLSGGRLTKGLVKTALTKNCYDSTAVKRVAGFRFRSIDETMAWMAAEYKKRKNG